MTTPTTSLLDLQAPAATAAGLAAGLGEADLARPTPCQIPVHRLLAHLLSLSVAFADAAAEVDGPTNRTAPAPDALRLPHDWRRRLPDRLDALVAAWRAPDAWSGLTAAAASRCPAR